MANKPKVVEIKTADLAGDALSYAVALATGTVDKKFRVAEDGSIKSIVSFEPWSNWYHGGPLFEQYGPTFAKRGPSEYFAVLPQSALLVGAWGPSHLIALCRAVVLDELGEVVEIPAAFVAAHAEALAKAKNDDQGQLQLSGSSLPPDIANVAAQLAKGPTPDQVEAEVKAAINPAEAKPAAIPGGKPGAEKAPAKEPAKEPAKPEEKPAAPAPANKHHQKPPQGRQAQAMKDHGQPAAPAGKGKGK